MFQMTVVTKSGTPSPSPSPSRRKPSWEFKVLTISLLVHGFLPNLEVFILVWEEFFFFFLNNNHINI